MGQLKTRSGEVLPSHKDEEIDSAWELRVVRDDLGFVSFGHLVTWKFWTDTVMMTLQQLENVGQVVSYVDLNFMRGLTGRPRYHKLSFRWYLKIL